MAVDGYSEEHYEKLAREIHNASRRTLRAKRPYDESSSEVPMICSKSKGLLTHSF